ncbi:MAG: hypothetical protein FWG65_02670 [Turicibacter sp.]|nr:hypothetical protein [Turicibacter sp.]
MDYWKRWKKTFLNIDTIGIPGECPFCESTDTDYFMMQVGNQNGFTEAWCNSCGKFTNICRRGPWDNEQLFPANRKIYTNEDYQAHQARRQAGERLSLTPPPLVQAAPTAKFEDERLAVVQI